MAFRSASISILRCLDLLLRSVACCLQGVYLLSGWAITQRHQASDSTFIRVTPRLFSRHLHMRLIGQIIRHSDCRVDASAVSWLESGAALLGSFQIAQSRRNRL